MGPLSAQWLLRPLAVAGSLTTRDDFTGAGIEPMWDRLNERMLPLQRRAIGTARIVVGRDGREWIVREVPPADLDRRQSPSLVFEASDIMRRVRTYPANWRELSDEELFELSMTW